MFGSLFGNGSSQSSSVLTPPDGAVHSNSHPCLPFFLPAGAGASERFSPPSPPGGSASDSGGEEQAYPESDQQEQTHAGFRHLSLPFLVPSLAGDRTYKTPTPFVGRARSAPLSCCSCGVCRNHRGKESA
jgi:hypothetical protein